MTDGVEELLGARRIALPAGVRFEDRGQRLRLVAERPLESLATGSFARPSCFVAWHPGEAAAAAGTRFGGYSWTQFALPVDSGSELGFRFQHGDTLVSPAVVFPLYARTRSGDCCLLAPLDGFHEQIVAIVDGELRWGWHGDLERVPAGFSTELGLFIGPGIRSLLERWGQVLRRGRAAPARDRYADPCSSHLSYWTDNGAAYWYRREPGKDLENTLADKLAELRDQQVPVHAVELDSWFYPHAKSRPVQEIGYLDTVPSTGMLRWEPREDLLPLGMQALRERLGAPPLILHSRHVAAESPYVDEAGWWIEHGQAHPRDPAFFARWLRDAADWGATAYEQDWMWVIFFGVRPLRSEPGRARAWQHGLDRAASEAGLSLIWCMSTPADFAAATELSQLAAIRTCDDYRYADDPAFLWTWFLVVNAMARALGLWPFKDVFLSRVDGEGIDGDPHAELEAALSALSAGPVGIGDRIGRSDPDVIARTCRADGVLVKPDRPIAALDGCLLGEPRRGERLLWAEADSGEWRYVLAVHVAEVATALEDRLALGGRSLVYDWRAGTAAMASELEVSLEPRAWRLFVVCPVGDGRALIGDPERYATMGDRRMRALRDGSAEVRGAAGEHVRVRWWSRPAGICDTRVTLPASGRIRVSAPWSEASKTGG